MPNPITIPIEFPGAASAAPQLAEIRQQLEQMAIAEERVSATATALGVSESQARTAIARAAQEQERAQQAVTTAQQMAQQQAIQFAHHMSGAAMAVQALTSQLGGPGGDRTAGLIGASINAATQFAQMGAVLGPGGALVGGILGSTVPALQSLRQASDDAARAARSLVGDLDTLIAAQQRQSATAERTRRLESGRGTLEEQSAYQQQAQQRAELALRALRGDEGAIRALRQQGVTGVADQEPSMLVRGAAAIGGSISGLFGGSGDTSVPVFLQEGERTVVQSLLEAALRDARHRAELISEGEEPGVPVGPQTPPPAGGRTGRTGARGASTAGGGGSTANPALDAALRSAAESRTGEQAIEGARARQEEFKRAAEEQIELEHQKADAITQTNEAAKRAHEEQMRMSSEQRERDRREAEQTRQQHEQQAHQYQGITQGVVQNVVDASVAMVAMHESAAHAFEKMLGAFLTMISQRAGLEAAAEYASAIASAARYDWPGFGQHTAAAVAWTGVAVAAGVGGAVLSAASQGGSAGATPASPVGAGGDRGQQGGTTVINFNAPVVTADTEARLGRTLMRLQTQGQLYYPNG